jgi:hypothetical protein
MKPATRVHAQELARKIARRINKTSTVYIYAIDIYYHLLTKYNLWP